MVNMDGAPEIKNISHKNDDNLLAEAIFAVKSDKTYSNKICYAEFISASKIIKLETLK